MIGRIIWFATLAALALLTAGLQLDMQSKGTAQLARAVPAPLRSYAQTHIAHAALQAGDAQLAVAEAKRLVRRRPLPAENLTLLAAAHARAGEVDQATQAIRIAGQRGWREGAAQEAVLRLALSAGDDAEAARRYAALFLRPQTPDRLLEELGPAVMGEAGGLGQQTVIAVVVGGERWHPQFLRRGASVMPPAAFSAIAAGSLAKGAQFDCTQLKQSAAAIAQRDAGAASTLRAAAARRCPDITG
ncbi:tetratricopeptide repeat protein [Erythrobacter sp. R86502]|uniref:tetratricopeptide repeat protein n=1 Tax=Erythrobacter sp. R86502 TaxID=3093846 RepID=UPI0036D3B312